MRSGAAARRFARAAWFLGACASAAGAIALLRGNDREIVAHFEWAVEREASAFAAAVHDATGELSPSGRDAPAVFQSLAEAAEAIDLPEWAPVMAPTERAAVIEEAGEAIDSLSQDLADLAERSLDFDTAESIAETREDVDAAATALEAASVPADVLRPIRYWLDELARQAAQWESAAELAEARSDIRRRLRNLRTPLADILALRDDYVEARRQFSLRDPRSMTYDDAWEFEKLFRAQAASRRRLAERAESFAARYDHVAVQGLLNSAAADLRALAQHISALAGIADELCYWVDAEDCGSEPVMAKGHPRYQEYVAAASPLGESVIANLERAANEVRSIRMRLIRELEGLDGR